MVFPDVIRHPVFGFFKVVKLFDHQPFLFARVVNVNPIFHSFGCCSCYRQCFYFRFLFFPCGNCILPHFRNIVNGIRRNILHKHCRTILYTIFLRYEPHSPVSKAVVCGFEREIYLPVMHSHSNSQAFSYSSSKRASSSM